MVHHHPPSRRRAQKTLVADRHAARLRIVADGHVLNRALQREPHRFDDHDLVELERQLGVAREQLLPARAHRP
jgi:hypothetical protein